MIKLSPLQKLTVGRLMLEFVVGDRILLLSPTRTGKTVMTIDLLSRLNAKGIVVTPRREIARQWAQSATLMGLSASVFARHGYDPQARLASTTMAYARQNLEPLMNGRYLWERSPSVSFDFLVFDEAHHIMSPTGHEIVRVFNAYCPQGKILGLTATATRSDKQDISYHFQGLVTVPHDMATLAGALSRYKVVRVESSPASLVEAWQRAGGLGKQAVFFVSRINQLQIYADLLAGYGARVGVLSGDTPPRERDDILSDYNAGRLNALVNVLVLTEGVDLNYTSIVVIAAEPATQTPLVQMAGRGLARLSGKPKPIIIVGDKYGNKIDIGHQPKPNQRTMSINWANAKLGKWRTGIADAVFYDKLSHRVRNKKR